MVPRKRFGQNFLKDNVVIQKIVQHLHLKPEDCCLEIGPGQGALTTAVLNHVKHLEVIEIDRDLCTHLINAYPSQLTVHQQDALKFDFATLSVTPQKKLRIFGNLPYNISTPLLFHLLTFSNLIEDMVFMLQKEVVMRMAAKSNNKDYGRLSIMIQYACEVHPLFDVGPQSFFPPPKVMSTVVKLIPYGDNKPHPIALNYAHFSNLVNVAFQHRRKTLKNALNTLVPPEVFAHCHIDPQRRSETLSVAEFVALSNIPVPL